MVGKLLGGEVQVEARVGNQGLREPVCRLLPTGFRTVVGAHFQLMGVDGPAGDISVGPHDVATRETGGFPAGEWLRMDFEPLLRHQSKQTLETCLGFLTEERLQTACGLAILGTAEDRVGLGPLTVQVEHHAAAESGGHLAAESGEGSVILLVDRFGVGIFVGDFGRAVRVEKATMHTGDNQIGGFSQSSPNGPREFVSQFLGTTIPSGEEAGGAGGEALPRAGWNSGNGQGASMGSGDEDREFSGTNNDPRGFDRNQSAVLRRERMTQEQEERWEKGQEAEDKVSPEIRERLAGCRPGGSRGCGTTCG